MDSESLIFIYAKDISKITRLSMSTAYRIATAIRHYFKKEKRSYITIPEFCEYMKLKDKYVRRRLLPKDKKKKKQFKQPPDITELPYKHPEPALHIRAYTKTKNKTENDKDKIQ